MQRHSGNKAFLFGYKISKSKSYGFTAGQIFFANKEELVTSIYNLANLAQLGERQTEDLKVQGSIP